jgi:glycosyltransferase involved in cell wall biosynthesis
MKIWIYTLCYNEEKIITFFLQHYAFADKIIVYDNESTDNSVKLFKESSLNCDIRTYKSNNTINDMLYLEIKNNAWKEARNNNVDYVIVVDMDEFLIAENNSNISDFLQKYPATIYEVDGFEMISTCENPVYKNDTPLTCQCLYGTFSEYYCKSVIFSPSQVQEINYFPGCHYCEPILNVENTTIHKLRLLHFKYAFGPQFVIDRYRLYEERLSEENKNNDFGHHYSWSSSKILKEYNSLLKNSSKIL